MVLENKKSGLFEMKGSNSLLFLFFIFCIPVWSMYSVVLVSGVQ